MSMQMASTKAQIVDPAVGYVNSHVVERKHSPIPKRNSLPTLDFLGPGSTVRLNFHQKTTIKNNNNNVKTNNLGSLLIPKDKTMRRPVEPCRLPHLVTQWQYNTNSVGWRLAARVFRCGLKRADAGGQPDAAPNTPQPDGVGLWRLSDPTIRLPEWSTTPHN